MGPFSAVLFLIGVIMFFVGRNRNNDDLFSDYYSRWGDLDTPEERRTKFMIRGILFIIAAVAIWVYLAINGEPFDLPDYKSLMNRNSSQ